jgi:hypothetical protein
MAYLEELLPEFRKGAKITNRSRDKSFFVQMRKDNGIVNSYGEHYSFDFSDFISDGWELYQEPINWDYIIKNKCLCWFWDDDESEKTVSILINAEKDEYTPFLLYDECYFEHCRPVRRDEVNFYEDKRDEI